MLDKGLYVLLQALENDSVDKVMSRAGLQIFPPTHGISDMNTYNGHKIGASATQKETGRWYSTTRHAIASNPSVVITETSFFPDFATEKEAVEHGLQLAKEAVDRDSPPWTINVKLPLPSAPISDGSGRGNKLMPPRYAQNETDALAICRQMLQAGCNPSRLDVAGPNDIHWDEFEIVRRLNKQGVGNIPTP